MRERSQKRARHRGRLAHQGIARIHSKSRVCTAVLPQRQKVFHLERVLGYAAVSGLSHIYPAPRASHHRHGWQQLRLYHAMPFAGGLPRSPPQRALDPPILARHACRYQQKSHSSLWTTVQYNAYLSRPTFSIPVISCPRRDGDAFFALFLCLSPLQLPLSIILDRAQVFTEDPKALSPLCA